MNQMEQFLSKLPHLRHLELNSDGMLDLSDGYRWQLLSSSLITFNFKFNINFDPFGNPILDSFRTSFWLKEKQWFVAFDFLHLFSIPYFAPKKWSLSHPSEYDSTAPDEKLFYDNINTLVLDSVPMSDKCYRFNYIKILEINCSISLETLSTIVNLNQVEHLILSMKSIDMITNVVQSMPRLNSLSLMDIKALYRIQHVQVYPIKQIRTLEFNSTGGIENLINGLSRIFPCIEYLIVSDMISKLVTIRLTDFFPRLSNVSFHILYLSIEDAEQNDMDSKLASSVTQHLRNNTYTCRFYRSRQSSLNGNVHLWIGE